MITEDQDLDERIVMLAKELNDKIVVYRQKLTQLNEEIKKLGNCSKDFTDKILNILKQI